MLNLSSNTLTRVVMQLLSLSIWHHIVVYFLSSFFFFSEFGIGFLLLEILLSVCHMLSANNVYYCCWNLQEECLQSLQNRIDVAYVSTIPLHQRGIRLTDLEPEPLEVRPADQDIAAKAWKKTPAWVPSLKGYVQVGTWKFSCL